MNQALCHQRDENTPSQNILTTKAAMGRGANYDFLVDPIALAGSLLSCTATFLVLVFLAVYAKEQRSFRQALVFNLATAEFINALNNSISGIYFRRSGMLVAGPWCGLNGWVGQVSVQASDFTMLAIALITLLTITEKVYMPSTSRARKAAICAAIWVVSLATGTAALAMRVYRPVGGNWCWIDGARTDLRYALTHGWRIAIILVIVVIYGYVWWHTTRHFRNLRHGDAGSGATTSTTRPTVSLARRASTAWEKTRSRCHVHKRSSSRMTVELPRARFEKLPHDSPQPPPSSARMQRQSNIAQQDDAFELRTLASALASASASGESSPVSSARASDVPALARLDVAVTRRFHAGKVGETPSKNTETASGCDGRRAITSMQSGGPRPLWTVTEVWGTHTGNARQMQIRRVEREIMRMLLMNAYPIMYVILWTPGLVNRFLEASGHKMSNRGLDALQASSAYIGCANALTYGFNQHLRRIIKREVFSWWVKRRWSNARF